MARYELEPSLRDVFVEGTYDQYLVAWFLRVNGLTQVAVYPIASVEILDENVLAMGLEANNKGRTIQLAKALCQKAGETNRQFTCIVDQDFDVLLKKIHIIPCLLTTDYTCMEMYLFNEETMDKFSSLVVKGLRHSPANVLAILAEPLQELFLIRLANHILKLGLKAMPFSKHCVFKGNRIDFDREEFVARYLHKNSKHTEMGKFELTIKQYRKDLREDCRFQINGHDFIEMLAWLVRVLTGAAIDSEMICSSLTACLESKALMGEHLFISLRERVGK